MSNNIVYTRFPPEPNGFLHLGHLKAMLCDFENSQFPKHDQEVRCYLRFDDTNPETEEQRFADAIIDDVKFFGFEPWKITYTSDYFPKLLELVWRLIKNGDAYVDFSSQEEMKRQRGYSKDKNGSVHWGDPVPSPYRDRSIADNVRDFNSMIMGKYKEGECCLRMKMDATSTNPNMRDLVAYTIKYSPHYRTKDKYCVYPSYEFAHCIVDALEKIDYSYCSLEFVTRQESYYWVIDKLGLHRPTVYEFSRLNFENSLLSKRKIKALIEDGKLDGWDDPRLLTIKGLRERGYTAEALKECVRTTNHTRTVSTLSIKFLESFVRDELNRTTERIFAVFDPVKVIIDNIDEDEVLEFGRPTHPQLKLESEKRTIRLTREIWIDRTDFRVEANKKYYRMTSKQNVRLKYTKGLLVYKSHEMNGDEVKLIHVEYIPDEKTKVKAYISWLSNPDARCVDFRHFNGDLLTDGEFNEISETKTKGFVEGYAKVDNRYQVERFGYFYVRDTGVTQIVSLREDKNR